MSDYRGGMDDVALPRFDLDLDAGPKLQRMTEPVGDLRYCAPGMITVNTSSEHCGEWPPASFLVEVDSPE